MTVSTSTSSVVYRGNGATTEFAVPFQVRDEAHLRVRRRVYETGEVEYTYVGTDYTYTGIGDDSGTLTLDGDPLDDDYELIIERIVPYTQGLDIVNAGGFYPETVEEQLDLTIMGIQQVADVADRGIVVPVGEDGMEMPKASERANMYLTFDADGNAAVTEGTGDGPDGAEFVLYTPAGAGASERSVQTRLRDTLSVKDYGTLGDGTNADAAFAAVKARALASGIKRIIIPAGHFLVTDFEADLESIVWEGDGDSSRITVGAANSNVFNVSAANQTFRGLRMEGDGTASATDVGNGINLTAEGLVVEDVLFDTFGQGAIYGTTSTSKKGPKLVRLRARDNGGGAGSFAAEVYLNGGWQSTLLKDADFVSSAALFGFLLAESGTSFWTDAEIRGGWFEGYARYGVGVTDEGYDGTYRTRGFKVNGGYYKDCVMGAIKAKQTKNIILRGVETEDCCSAPENALGGLRGSILLHGVGSMLCSDFLIVGSGSTGLQVTVPFAAGKMFPSGVGMPSVKIHNGVVDGPGATAPTYGDAIGIIGPCKDVTIKNCTGRYFTRYGLYAECTSTQILTQTIAVSNNRFVDSPTANSIGIYIKRAVRVTQDGNTVHNVDLTGSHHEDVQFSNIGSTDRAGDSISASLCYSFVDVVNVSFDGSASCYEFAAHQTTFAYVVGDRVYNGDKVYECTVAGNSGGASPPTGTGTAIVDGTVTWSYVQRRRKNTDGLSFSGVTNCVVGAGATFENLVGSWAGGVMPTILRRANYYTNSGSLVAGVATFTLAWPEPDNNYIVVVDGGVNETFFVPDAGKTTTQFEVHSSNAASTAFVRVSVSR